MPLTVFDVKGPGHRRERIEAAVVAGGKHASAPCEAWIAADPFKDGFRFLITAVIYRRAAACAGMPEQAR
jgi:hypothetical protein